MGYFIDDIQAVKQNNRWHFIDRKNQRIIDRKNQRITYAEYHNISDWITSSFVPIYKPIDKYFEFYNIKTKKTLGIKTYTTKATHKNYLHVGMGRGLFLLYNKKAKRMFDFGVNNIKVFSSDDRADLFAATVGKKSDKRMGILNKESHQILPISYKSIEPIYDDKQRILYLDAQTVFDGNELFDAYGKVLISEEYSKIKHIRYDKKYLLIVERENSDQPHHALYKAKAFETPIYQAHIIVYERAGRHGLINFKADALVKAIHHNIISLDQNWFATYNGNNSKIYQIGRKKPVATIAGKVDLMTNIIVAQNGKSYDLYDYTFNKRNKIPLSAIKTCQTNPDVLMARYAKNQWTIIHIKDKKNQAN